MIWICKKGPGFRNQVPEEPSPHLLLGPKDWVWSKINFLVGPQEPLLATVKRRTLAWFGHAVRQEASPKSSFRTPWRMGDAVVGRGNVGRTTPKRGHLCPCQDSSKGPPAEKAGRGSLLNRSSGSADDSFGQATEMNQTDRVILFPSGNRRNRRRRRRLILGHLKPSQQKRLVRAKKAKANKAKKRRKKKRKKLVN